MTGFSDADRVFTRLVNARVEDVQDAVGRVAAAHPDQPRLQREALDRLDIDLDDWSEEDDFIHEPLHDQVVAICERLGLPPELARQWETLPPPPQTFDPAEATPPRRPRRSPKPTPADGAKRP